MSTLDRLLALPCMDALDRLYVGADGCLYVDGTYRRLGSVGRAFLDRTIGGYNRGAILGCLESLLTDLCLLTERTRRILENPYTLGNARTYGLFSQPNQELWKLTPRMLEGLRVLQALLVTLEDIYSDQRERIVGLSETAVSLVSVLEGMGRPRGRGL